MQPHLVSLPWKSIQTLLLDMDGTLLDLHFDSFFWREYIPFKYAEKRGLDTITAKKLLVPRFKAAEQTLNWYCIDYWSQSLDLDIALLKKDLAHLIGFKPHAQAFLNTMRNNNKRLILVTNAHEKSLSIKLEHTLLDQYLDQIVSAHEIGHPKESPIFWNQLKKITTFAAEETLLIDDNLHALRSAKNFGIQHLLAVSQPSSKDSAVDTGEFMAMSSFSQLLSDFDTHNPAMPT